jgi:hypothetical protein
VNGEWFTAEWFFMTAAHTTPGQTGQPVIMHMLPECVVSLMFVQPP